MKKILLAACFLFQSAAVDSKVEIVVFNIKSDQIYFVETDSSQNTVVLKSLNEKTLIPLVCANEEVIQLNQVNFSAAPQCLMRSLNQTFHLNIEQYVDFQDRFSIDELKAMVSNLSFNDVTTLAKSVNTNINWWDTLAYYDFYTQFEQKNLHSEYPLLIKGEQGYLPISGFMETEQKDTYVPLKKAAKK